MFKSGIFHKLRNLSLCAIALPLSSFCQANDFASNPNYNNFKTKTMQTYGLSEQQVDWAMNGSKNIPSIINIMNIIDISVKSKQGNIYIYSTFSTNNIINIHFLQTN